VATAGRFVTGLDLGAMSAAALRSLVGFLAVVGESSALAAGLVAGGVVATFGVVFVPVEEPKGRWVRIGGPGDISYFQQPDETAIRFKYKTADDVEQSWTATPGPDGNYRGPDGRVMARWVKAAARVGLVISTAALVGHDRKEPELCPKPSPDKLHGNVRASNYEDFVKQVVNPGAPTPRGLAYVLLNHASGRPVYFDDCQRSSGVMVDAKGPGYADHLTKMDWPGRGMAGDLMSQAQRQVDASEGRPIVWFFADKGAADVARDLLRRTGGGTERIRVVTLPWWEKKK
jgi:hypothetical protein